ncbi:RNA-guided endonuclease InsQ/TnpB family protein [Agromyces sp. NPDC057679]|uniref:RNA-guided endonuclease InsQ/TnpB family protein n=1 Tax=Agromyces sp. NPDC057679 TaxID=3346207 RepID=UPI00367198CB
MDGVMKRRYSYEIVPGLQARGMLARTFGSTRVVFNDFVAANRARRAAGEAFLGYPPAAKRLITDAKTTPERVWLREVSTDALQQSLRDADLAYRNFFNSIKGRRKGRRVGAPRFKTRHARQSARFTVNGFRLRGGWENTNPGGGRLYLAKIGNIPVRWSRPLPAAPSSVTVTREPDGRYFASFVVDVPDTAPVEPAHPGRVAGIDLGLKAFATIVYSDGTAEQVGNPRYFQAAQRRLARAQRSLARKVKGSKNRAKQRAMVAQLHRHVRNQRTDHARKLVRRLIDENQVIGVETLSITGIARVYGKQVHDAGWGGFLTRLASAAAEHGRDLVAAEGFFPSTQTCHACGSVEGPKGREGLRIRAWVCSCSTTHDRDRNAATNLMLVAAGQAETENARGGAVSPAPVLARPEEAGTRPTRTAAA